MWFEWCFFGKATRQSIQMRSHLHGTKPFHLALHDIWANDHWQTMGRTFAAGTFCIETCDRVNCNTCNLEISSVELSWEILRKKLVLKLSITHYCLLIVLITVINNISPPEEKNSKQLQTNMLFRNEIQYFWREEYTGFSDDVPFLSGK